MHRNSRLHITRTVAGHPLLKTLALGTLFISASTYAFSQFPVAKVSRQEWGLHNPSKIVIAQVSLVTEEGRENLLIYGLRDTLPPAPSRKIVARAPQGSGGYFVLSDFAYSQSNSLEGVFATYRRDPSSSSVELADTRDGDRALRFTFNRKKEGYCGFWIQLFNSFDSPDERIYLDSSPFSALSFWVRGSAGGEKVMLKVADAQWMQKDDAIAVGDVGTFTSSGRIDTTWGEAVIPLDRIPSSIKRDQLASLVFEADTVAKGSIELKTLALCRDKHDLPPFRKAPPPPSLEGTQKAVWVWNTKAIVENPNQINRFIHFLTQQGFTAAFLAIPYQAGQATQSGSVPVPRGVLNTLIGKIHASNIRVSALFGDKSWALPAWHSFVLSTVKNVGRFNAESAPAERFDGIHLDVEPYLLPGFNGPRHDEFLKDYLTMLSDVCDEAHRSHLTVGADIPFWYGEPDEFTHTVTRIRFGGSEKPVFQHILDMADNIAIMSYRTAAFGTDGVIAHSLAELAYAQQVGKTVFVGLETGPISDERILTFRGSPQKGVDAASEGNHLFMFPSADSLTFYLVSQDKVGDFLVFLRSKSIDPWDAYSWTTNSVSTIPGTRLSFADLGAPQFRKTMKEAFFELHQFKSFGGFAIHHFSSFKRMLQYAPDE